ncbi:CRISPR-associated endonuclease Cas2 [Candidatus Curtissbacteria bacterium RIFCSPHIGHO2_01_FULL_41_13]|uniref:CRISPR-associated endonuclease Cas2 n=1 Tax=Candidatus Curtissbacteria bacterium RIFCSPHIGHO2_01_FULL_41_13 TaxID=1797745 RepID=A0A1F5G282_9BACT|nr:MAG: CRISPR-associated endonuclease Cas2 [Candidatus Curtissbacteria bacterium RIFCSPHIGHO2_01_FULL_41_13]
MKISPRVKDILLVLGVGAVVVTSVVAPGLPRVIYYLVKQNKDAEKKLAKFNHRLFNQELKRLKKVGSVKFVENNGGLIAQLTKEGENKIAKYQFEGMKIQKPKRWDRKWRLIIFDIPEWKKKAREMLREKLKSLGFYQLQKSVYIYPFPCIDEITILRENYDLDISEVMYLLVEKFEGRKISIQNFN